jgi:hypothetical protein
VRRRNTRSGCIRHEFENEADGSIPPENSINEIPRVVVNITENQVIKNIVIRRNDVTLKEISEEIALETKCIRSISCILKLKSMQITRKRLTLVPVERNSMPTKKELWTTYVMNVSEIFRKRGVLD